ncbi:hypothetical protein ACET3Z_000057 [Daucus carota]
MDAYILNIHSIAAQGLSKPSSYYARVSILGDDQISEWTTHVDKQGGNNPRWNQQRTIMLNKTNVHRELVYVVVKIFDKRFVLDKCVGQVRVPIGQTIDYETQRFALSRSKFQINKAKGAIKLACRIEPLQVTAAETHEAHHAQQAAAASSSSYQQGFCIGVEGLIKASPYYAEVSVVGDDGITKWTTCVDKQGGKNPKWNKERTVMLNRTNVHRNHVYVVVKIYEKGIVLDNCVGEVRVPVGERIDYETERFALVRSKFQVKKARGAIKLACRIEALQVTAETHEFVIAFPAGSANTNQEEIFAPAPAPAPAHQAAPAPAPAPAYAHQATSAPAPAPAHQAAPAPAPVYAHQAAPAPAATALSGMTANNLSYQPAVYSQVPPIPPLPGSFSSPVNYQQGAPDFWYPQPPPPYYQPMPQQPPRLNDLGVGAFAPLVMMAANTFGTTLPDVVSSDFWSSFG